MTIEALVSLRGDNLPAVGRERIRLLEAVARAGSISGGARAVGLTYKAAWDGIDAMANLLGRPLLETRAGGRSGGGAVLTETGLRLVEAFRRLEAELERSLRALEPALAGTGLRPEQVLSGFLMKTSARNALRGTVTRIVADAIAAEVSVAVGEAEIHALVTNASVRELGLVPGREAIVLIKAPFVMVATGERPPLTSARNCLKGTVLRCEKTPVSAEVVLDVGGGRTLAATVTAASADALGLAAGLPAFALVDAAHVLLAID